MAQLILIAVMIVAFYLLFFLPNQLQTRRVRKMQDSLAVGDQVVTIAGLVGSVAELGQDVVTLDVGHGTKIRVTRSSITQRAGPSPSQ